jgi:hypothetical protein
VPCTNSGLGRRLRDSVGYHGRSRLEALGFAALVPAGAPNRRPATAWLDKWVALAPLTDAGFD